MSQGVRNRALPAPTDVVVGGDLPRRAVTIRLVGGPCDGTIAKVIGFGKIAWQRIPGKTPWWARYDRTSRGIYTFEGTIIGLDEMAAKIAAQGRGRVMGSHGA